MLWKTKMYLACFIVILLKSVSLEGKTIGGIFYEGDDGMKEVLLSSAKMYDFDASIKEVTLNGGTLEVTRYVCELAQEGVVGIIDGTGGRASENIQAICDTLELPHVTVKHNDLYTDTWTLLNLYPSPVVYNKVLQALIDIKGWQNFTILYVKGHSLLRVGDLLNLGNETDRFTVAVRELSGDNYRDVLINAKQNGFTNFIVDCPSSNLEQILLHAQQVGLMADEHSYIFVSPDLFTLDLNRYRYGGVNMTGLRLANLENKSLKEFTERVNNETMESMLPEQIKTHLLLVHDAVVIFSEALKKFTVFTQQLNCEEYDSWVYGTTLMNFMKTNLVDGITRTLIFDGLGQRIDTFFDIIELTPAGSQNVGTWKDNKLLIKRPYVPDAEIGEESILRNKSLKVLIAVTPPFGYRKVSPKKLTGNDRYEGYTIDLIERLSQMLGFYYVFEEESVYGDISEKTGEWTGMVAQLMNDHADLAICDFTMTVARQSAIDFSTPFMTLGIGILYKEPSKQPPEMFSFMAVFSEEVWYYMLLIQFCLGIVMIFVGRISHKEWQNPVPCIEQPEELSNQFSFANSLWLIIGSVMQQGSEIAPIALAPRMITSVWWFFTMVMVASYVGTLVAFLIVEKNVLPFQTVEELSEKPISYGAKEKGSTIQYFAESRNPIYKKMYKNMLDNHWLVQNNDVGVELCENSTYAFFSESTAIEYYKERHCDLLQVGGLLDSKSYGIGMKKNSPYKRYIDDALLQLKENGELSKLKDLWWKEKYGGGNCREKQAEDHTQLGLKNMLGAFVVLGAGCIIGLFISTLDMLWGVFKKSVKYGTTFKYELIEELKFFITFSGNVKPVKRLAKPESSAEILALTEGKDEIRSLRSFRSSRSYKSGHSGDTHRTQHSHKSRHSSRSMSVAFAKRREYT